MQKIKVRIGVCLLPLCFVLLNLLEGATGAKDYSRHEFPPKFIFGASTSAYQVIRPLIFTFFFLLLN